MGDRATMTALVPTSAGTGHTDARGAFRHAAMAAPPALQALVHAGAARLRPASDAHGSPDRRNRIMHATGKTPDGAGTVLGLMIGSAVALAPIGGVGGVLGLVGGLIAGISLVAGGNRRHLKTALLSPTKHGFAVEGYEDWLLSGRPIFDLELAGPPDEVWLAARLQITAYSVAKAMDVPWVEHVTWLSSTLVRVETKPMLVEPAGNAIAPFYGGSQVLFEQLIREVLVPLHATSGIVAVRMGGYVDRRVNDPPPTTSHSKE